MPALKKIKTQRRKIASILLAMSTLLIMIWVTAWGVADILSWPAKEAMKSWKLQKGVDHTAQWQRVTNKMLWAQRLNPNSADYAMYLGRLYEWRALNQPPWTTHAHFYREKAIEYFTTATKQRPSWGFAWIHYAKSKILNQEYGHEAIAALEKAMVLAPWEVVVQRKVIRLGMSMWHHLSVEMQQQINRAVQRALILQPKRVIKIAIKFDWETQLRPMLTSEKDISYLNQRLSRRAAVAKK